ncbi:Bardet-Biedl syndrome 5 -like protein, partial [Trichinella murrelli]
MTTRNITMRLKLQKRPSAVQLDGGEAPSEIICPTCLQSLRSRSRSKSVKRKKTPGKKVARKVAQRPRSKSGRKSVRNKKRSVKKSNQKAVLIKATKSRRKRSSLKSIQNRSVIIQVEIPLKLYKAVSVYNSRDYAHASVQKNLKHYDVIREDRDVRYDVDSKQLKLRNGEFIVDKSHGIENTKANRRQKGTLIVTNLRIIWLSHASSKINL